MPTRKNRTLRKQRNKSEKTTYGGSSPANSKNKSKSKSKSKDSKESIKKDIEKHIEDRKAADAKYINKYGGQNDLQEEEEKVNEKQQNDVQGGNEKQQNEVQGGNEKQQNNVNKVEQVVGGKTCNGYCVSCKRKRTMKSCKNKKTKNGRNMLSGVCANCGTKMAKFVK
jgi:hypothetical protein